VCSSSSKALLLNSILNVTQKRYKHVRAVDKYVSYSSHARKTPIIRVKGLKYVFSLSLSLSLPPRYLLSPLLVMRNPVEKPKPKEGTVEGTNNNQPSG